ncbi:MAG: hypothetical protein H6719_12515 [Sandaracinaceae bacterium]|nr:hypothetical protein [Sandaracinaceae bacterium]
MRQPPPPPPNRRRIPPPPQRGALPRLPAPPPQPSQPPPPGPDGPLLASTRGKLQVAGAALALRQEQVAAIVRYYGADQQTNSELDAITAAVVAELQQLQLAGEERRDTVVPDVEIELIQSLRELLEKLFSAKRRNFVERKIRDIQRRISQLFFNSELYYQLAMEGGRVESAEWPEQALYYAVKIHEQLILEELATMPTANEEIRERALDQWHTYTRRLRTDFLSRTTPELERLLGIYRDVLADFFFDGFGRGLGEFCWKVVRESRVAAQHELGYKIKSDKFPAFREAFDKHFLESLVFHVQEPITKRATESDRFRDATARFVASPEIHSEICTVINDAVYDYLHGEGFLDLPSDWRHVLSRF